MKQMKMLLVILGVGIMLLCSTQAFASLFSDDFEGDLSAWTGRDDGSSNGKIVENPSLNAVNSSENVLYFTALDAGGDIYTADSFGSPTGGQYILSFDYLGYPKADSVKDDFGGFIGYSYDTSKSNHWLDGTRSYPGLVSDMTDNNGWNSYSIAFSANAPFHIMIEDWSGSGGVAGDAYFDNIELNTAPVPEPATMLLLGFGLLGLVGFRKKLIKS